PAPQRLVEEASGHALLQALVLGRATRRPGVALRRGRPGKHQQRKDDGERNRYTAPSLSRGHTELLSCHRLRDSHESFTTGSPRKAAPDTLRCRRWDWISHER